MQLLCLFLFLTFLMQESAFFSSVLLAPISLVLFSLYFSYSITHCILYSVMVAVLVGGLLVLLMSVTSILMFEQSSSKKIAILIVLVGAGALDWVQDREGLELNLSSLSSWVVELSFLVLILGFLVLSLLVISSFFLKNKFLVRNECFLSVKHGSFSWNK